MHRILLCLLVLVPAATMAALEPPSPAAIDQADQSFVLRPGVVIDPARSALYRMTPEGGVAAHDLDTGAERWTSDAAARPLGLWGGHLVTLTEATAPAATQVVFLDLDSGDTMLTVPVTLPEGVLASIDDRPNRSFDATLVATPSGLFLYWSYTERPLRGAAIAIDSADILELDGVVRLDPLSGGAAAAVSAPPRPSTPTPDLGPDETLTGVSGRQFRAADDRHVLASEKIADAATWNRYRWTFHDRVSGARLGTVDQPRSMAPFFLAGDLLIHESMAFTRRVGAAELDRQPLQLRAIDLDTGRERWTLQLRDTTYRGPLPP